MFNDANFLDKYVCSFCENTVPYNNVLLGLGDAAICEDCIDLYYDILNISKDVEFERPNVITPKTLFKELSKVVVGQFEAKKVLSVAVSNHYKRIKYQLDVEKSNVLMIGPSGCGKTLLAKTLAKIIDVPIAIVDATVYTEAGYVGEDVENILLRLLQNANFDKEKAECGIVFIDEIDKLSRKTESTSITRDVSGEGVQNSLLKIIEGNVINIPPTGGRKHPYQDYITFDTSNVLFICAGAFDGLKLTSTTKNVGFMQGIKEKEIDINSELIKYGIIPELLGRLPVLVKMDSLSKEELKEILLLKDYGVISQYEKLLHVDNIELIIKESAISKIVELAYKSKGGARSLKKVLENVMLDVMFDTCGNSLAQRCIISDSTIDDHSNYTLIDI